MRPSLSIRSIAALASLCGVLPTQVTATAVDTLLTVGPATFDPGRQQPVMLHQTVFQRPLFGTLRSELATWNGADWVPVLPPVELPIEGAVLVHDAVQDRLVAFDGGQRVYFISGTSVAYGPAVPSPVSFQTIEGRGLVHDLARDEYVVFGGSRRDISQPFPVTVYHDETYVLRQGAWQQLPLAVRPSVRSGYALVYDPARQRTVLFGGRGSPSGANTALGDTWEWDGSSWTQVQATGPAAGNASGVFDPSTGRVVLRDGVGDVWSFDGAVWTQVAPATTPVFSNSTLVHDGQALLLAGGWVPGFPTRSLIETWRLEPTGWTRVPTSVHMQTDYSAVVTYDTVRHELVCLHGNPLVTWIPGTTWTWNGTWREHAGAAPDWGGMAFDRARGEAVVFGGATGGETWTWNGASWTRRSPAQSPPPGPSGVAAPLAYDAIRQHVVLSAASGSWLWDGVTWTQPPGPQPPPGQILVWDPVRGAVVLSGTTSGETWEWTGQWQQVTASGGPQGSWLAAFDPSRGRTFSYEPGIEREWTGTSWVTRPLPVPMDLQYARAMATDTDRGRMLFRGVIAPAQGIRLYVLGPTPSRVVDAGGGCPSGGIPLHVEQRPAVGETIELVTEVDPGGLAIFGFAFQAGSWPLGSCTQVVDGSLGAIWRFAGTSGRGDLPLPIAAAPALRGVAFHVQAVALRAGVPALSRALRLHVGD